MVPSSANILKESVKQVVLELWENKRGTHQGWQQFRKNTPGQSPLPFFFKSLPRLSILDMGVLISEGLKPCLDGVFRGKMESCKKKKKKRWRRKRRRRRRKEGRKEGREGYKLPCGTDRWIHSRLNSRTQGID